MRILAIIWALAYLGAWAWVLRPGANNLGAFLWLYLLGIPWAVVMAGLVILGWWV